MNSIEEMSTSIKDFCWKHRYKIGVGAVCLAGGVALYYYLNEEEKKNKPENSSNNSSNIKNNEKNNNTHNNNNNQNNNREINPTPEDIEIMTKLEKEINMKNNSNNHNNNHNTNNNTNNNNSNSEADDARLSAAVTQLYGFSIVYFLPNIPLRLKRIIDVSDTIKRLKELKNDHSDESRDLKVSLWDNIKVSSFTTLLTIVYSLSAATVLLQLQMHMLVRDAAQISNLGSNEGNHEEDIFHALMEGSYTTFFNSGLEKLSNLIKEIVTLQISGWSVESQLNVEYTDVVDTIGTIRKELEGDISKIINTLIFPSNESINNSVSPNKTKSNTSPSKNGPQSEMLQNLIQQTFTLVTLPVFHNAYEETLSSVFQYVFEQLKTFAFSIPNDALSPASATLISTTSTSPTKNLPLASLLPKVKSITARLIPDDLAKNPSYLHYLKSITSGPQVSSLCSRVFISPLSEISPSSFQPNSNVHDEIDSNINTQQNYISNNSNTPPKPPIRWPTPNPPTISSFALDSFRSALPLDDKK